MKILFSILGSLLGLALISLISPWILWQAEHQELALLFDQAKPVAQAKNGEYALAQGKPTPVGNWISCPDKTSSCVLTQRTIEKLQEIEKDYCGQPLSSQFIIRQIEDKCPQNGSCEHCYRVREKEWVELKELAEAQTVAFILEGKTVQPGKANHLLGEKVTTALSEGETTRTTYHYLPVDNFLLGAGDLQNNELVLPVKNPFVVSNLSRTETLLELQSQDTATKWMLRILSLFLMILGMILFMGPLMVLTDFFRLVPFVGKHIDRGIDGVLKLLLALLGVLLWGISWVSILIVTNIYLISLVLLIGVGLFFLFIRTRKTAPSDSSIPS